MTTLNLQVGASADDANEDVGDGSMNLTRATLPIGSDRGGFHVGLRFTGVSGLSGATINTGTLTFRASATYGADFIGDWYAEDAAAPGTFTSGNSDISNRTQTTATCEGDGTDFGAWTNGQDETFTGDGVNTIADILQELADSYDPSTIVLVHIYTSGGGLRGCKSYDDTTSFAPKLDIDYTADGGETRDLAGSQPTATGILARFAQVARALTGNQPFATGVLTRIERAVRAFTGNQPTATGILTRVFGRPRLVAGTQPAATGILIRVENALRALAGVQPAPSGTLVRKEQALRAPVGNQPFATGTLPATLIGLSRSLAGNQPTSIGILVRIEQAGRTLAGDQPAFVGILIRVEHAERALLGSQPAAEGTLLGTQLYVAAPPMVGFGRVDMDIGVRGRGLLDRIPVVNGGRVDGVPSKGEGVVSVVPEGHLASMDLMPEAEGFDDGFSQGFGS